MGNTLTALAVMNTTLGNTLTVQATCFLIQNNSSAWVSPSALSAYVALMALLFTLLSGFVFKFITKPKLIASMTNEAPDSHNIVTNSSVERVGQDRAGNRIVTRETTPYESRYFRINISNAGILSNLIVKRPAKNVEVYGMNLFKENGGWFEKIEQFLPRNFTWAHMKEGENIYSQRITHLNSKHCDIFYIVKDNKYLSNIGLRNIFEDKKMDITALPAILLTNVKANHFDWILEPGTYLIQVSISSDESRPKYYEIKVNHKGTWDVDSNCPDTQIDYCLEINPKRTTEMRIRSLN